MLKVLKKMWDEFVYGGHLLSCGASGIVLAHTYISNHNPSLIIIFLPYLISQTIYTYNHVAELKTDTISNPERSNYLQAHSSTNQVIFYFVLLLLFSIFSNIYTLVYSVVLVSSGILYTNYFKGKSSNMPVGFKNFYTSFFWANLAFLTPIVHQEQLNISHILIFAFIFFRLLTNTSFFDIKDIVDDKKRGIRTFAIILGKDNSLLLSHIFNISSLFIILFSISLNILPYSFSILACFVFYSFIYLLLTRILNLSNENIRKISYVIVDGEYVFWPIMMILFNSLK